MSGGCSGSSGADPKFLNYNPAGIGDYRLAAGSPAANRGILSYAPAIDLIGTPRPLGGADDIGAYESH